MQMKVILTVMRQLKQLQRKPGQKKFWGSNRIQAHDLHDTGAMLYQLSYEASPEASNN